MKEDVLSILRNINQPRKWDEVSGVFAEKGEIVKKIGEVVDEPTYEFFETYSEDLVLNLNAIAISAQPTNSYIPYHVHNYIEIIIPLAGQCTVYLNKQKIVMDCNDVLFVGNNTVHKVAPINKDDVVVNITLKKSAFSVNDLNFLRHNPTGSNIFDLILTSLADHNENRYIWFKVNNNKKIINNIYDIIDEYYQEKQDNQSRQVIRFSLLTLFSRLICQSHIAQIASVNDTNSRINLLSLLLYIEKNYKTITLNNMAQTFNFNPNYLSTYLKKETGHTFIKLVHLQRVNVAEEYLLYTNASIESIASEVGYENPSYFYKIFKDFFGISPAVYREQSSSK